ncbi:MAG TPA: DUF6705 family protein [Flavobacteriaceae bacterium]|nr:DUF6705 family protein [Flavobacteriaceae bacterium]
MKNYITIIALFILSLSCKAQYNNIVPIENYHSYVENHNITQGTYFKDVNNVLNKYVGTWKGEFDGKQYTIKAHKSSKTTISGRMKKDLIYIRYTIKDPNDNIIKKTIDVADAPALQGKLFDEDNPEVYTLLYYVKDDNEVECGNVGTMFIETLNNNTKLKLYVEPDHMIFFDIEGEPDPCPNGRIFPPFPEEDNPMILTKQNSPQRGAINND